MNLSNGKICRRVLLAAVVCMGLCVSVIGFQFYWSAGDVRVIYSLDERKNDLEIISLIDSAKSYVYFAVYYFTKKDIAEALIRAKQRGLVVEGIMDREGIKQASNKAVFELIQSAGIPIITQKHLDGIMHLKVVVTDRAYASGSYNWTQAATDANDEVLEIGTNKKLRKAYLEIVKRVLDINRSEDTQPGEVSKIDFSEAKQHIGKYAEVSGELLKVHRSASGTTFLNFCKSSTKCPFTAVIFASDADKFSDISKFVGAVILSGIVRSYKNSAEIVLSDPSQIRKK